MIPAPPGRGTGPSAEPEPPAVGFRPLRFADLRGWAEDDHAAALAAFRLSAAAISTVPPRRRALGVSADGLSAVARDLLALPAGQDRAPARAFFEERFQPAEVIPAHGGDGFFTGYYEPEVEGSQNPTARFSVPLYRRPPDLVEIDDRNRPPVWDPELRFGRATGGAIEPYYDRGEIEAGVLRGRGLELVWLADPVDAFFIHIQGSARIRLTDGGTLRLTYDGKSGHAYTPIGRAIADRIGRPPAEVTMAVIRAWLAAHPAEAPAMRARNRSFIFFRQAPVADRALGPIAAAGVPLSPGRSLAVDRLLHTFHTPVWVETVVPAGGASSGTAPFHRLLIAQDTGSAIVGPARGDIFFGSGSGAGAIAGSMRAAGRFVVLVPRGTALP